MRCLLLQSVSALMQDPHFQEMRTPYTDPFLQKFNMGCPRNHKAAVDQGLVLE